MFGFLVSGCLDDCFGLKFIIFCCLIVLMISGFGMILVDWIMVFFVFEILVVLEGVLFVFLFE